MTVCLRRRYTTMAIGIGHEVPQFSTAADQPTVRPSPATLMRSHPTCSCSPTGVRAEPSSYTTCALFRLCRNTHAIHSEPPLYERRVMAVHASTTLRRGMHRL